MIDWVVSRRLIYVIAERTYVYGELSLDIYEVVCKSRNRTLSRGWLSNSVKYWTPSLVVFGGKKVRIGQLSKKARVVMFALK
jgi:hypothetical protein